MKDISEIQVGRWIWFS